MGDNYFKLFCLPTEKGSILKENNLLLFEQIRFICFILETAPFQKGFCVQKNNKHEVKKSCLLVKLRENSAGLSNLFI